MAGTIQTANKRWTSKEALLSMLGQGFNTPEQHAADADPSAKVCLRFVFVEDSGEEYYQDKKWTGWDRLAKDLTDGTYTSGQVALRVCIGQAATNPLYETGQHTARHLGNSTLEQLALRCIGKATDGGPCVRLGAIDLTALIAALDV